MNAAIWLAVLAIAVFVTHWGAEHIAEPLKKLRRQWGLSTAAGGAIVGLAAASPEVGINIASAVQGVSEIGLGAMLGSNIYAIPLVVAVGYAALRLAKIRGGEASRSAQERHQVPVAEEAVTIQALPYLAILALVAILTLPKPWRGLQPIDGWIMLGAYGLYLAQALMRKRHRAEEIRWSGRELVLAVGGVLALAGGAFFVVRATENLVTILGMSRVLGGLFIAAPMAALPEILASWSIARSGEVTSGMTSVIGDNAVTMTVGMLPLALVSTQIHDFRLFATNLGALVLMPALYAAFIRTNREGYGFNGWHVCAFAAVLAAYVIVVLVPLLRAG